MKDHQLREQFRALYDQFQKSFPDVKPPEVSWWGMWLNKYDPKRITAAITATAAHYPSGKTTDDIGKIISARLRDEAVEQALLEEVQNLGTEVRHES
jgi:hypothetical protein